MQDICRFDTNPYFARVAFDTRRPARHPIRVATTKPIFPDFANKRFLRNLLLHPHGRKMVCAMFHMDIESDSLRKFDNLLCAVDSLPAAAREDANKLL